MSHLGPLARSLVESGREADRSTPADRARVRARLARAIAAGAVATTAGATVKATTASAAAAKATATAPWLLALKVAVPVAVFAVAGAGVVAQRTKAEPASMSSPSSAMREQPPALPPPSVGASRVAVDHSDDIVDPPAPDSLGAPEAPAAAEATSARPMVPPTARAHPPSAEDPLAIETNRLREVHAALQEGDPARALALLDHAPPSGRELDEERAAARVVALCRLGKLDEGRAAMRTFLTHHPGSLHAVRVRAACDAK